MKPVLFYSHREGPFAAFSNFYPASFELDGWTWACSEQAFMSYKSKDKSYQAKIRRASNPFDAKSLGRNAELRPDWDGVKFEIMVKVLEAKFGQNPDLRDLLLSTGEARIHENCSDPWWGGGPNFPRGKDLLGRALMRVRSKLAQEGVESVS